MNDTTWKPERKIVGGAIAVILMFIATLAFPELDIPTGIEGALTVIVAYLLPNKATPPDGS